MCSVPKEFTASKKRKYLLLHESDWLDGACNEMPGIVVGAERWAKPERYPCVAVEVTISGITRFDFVYPGDFPGKKGETMAEYRERSEKSGGVADVYLTGKGGFPRPCLEDGTPLAGLTSCRVDDPTYGAYTVTATFEVCGWVDKEGRVRKGKPFVCPTCGAATL